MKKLMILFALSASAAMAEPTAFVINSLAETMSKIDLVSGGIQNHITVLGETPNDIDLENGFLYVVNSISADLQKIDPVSHSIVATIPMPVGSNPYAVDAVGNFAYVSCWVSGVIYRINTSENRIDSTITIGGYPEGIIYSDGMIYVTQTAFNPGDFSYGQGRVAIIDAATFQLAGEVNVGSNPQTIVQAPGGLLHIICTGNYVDLTGSVYIFNPYTDVVEDSILIGGQPVSGVITHDGIGYLAAGGWISNGIVLSYDIHSKQILHDMSNPINVGLGATDIALDSLGFLYTTNFGNDTVTKLSSGGQIMGTYQMGDGPQALVIMDDRSSSGIIDDGLSDLPVQAGITGNYPNPFNANTIIKYTLPTGAKRGEIVIYDIEGRLIRSFSTGTELGIGEVVWDGRTETDVECASGIYLARLVCETAGGSEMARETLRIALTK